MTLSEADATMPFNGRCGDDLLDDRLDALPLGDEVIEALTADQDYQAWLAQAWG